MTDSPSAEEVRAALSRVMSSVVFSRARRAPAFLRYITEETLAGRASDISGYTIALAVFGKGPDFDAVSDPLVRVEAGRLRSRLIEYYATDGVADAVRIELQRGSYVPSFRLAPTPARPAPKQPRGRSRWAIPGVLAALLIIGVVVLLTRGYIGVPAAPGVRAVAYPGAPVAADSRTGPRILVQPFHNSGDQQSLSFAFGTTEEIMTRLARYPDLIVIVGSSGYVDRREGGVIAVEDATADYLLTGALRASDQTIYVEARLTDVHTGRQVWATSYDQAFDVANVWSILDAVADAVATTVGEPFGPLYGAEIAHIERAAEQNVDSYHCSLRFLFAVETMSETAHARATACFERDVTKNPTSSMSWARLAALYRMEYLHDFNSRPGGASALDRALEAVRNALDNDHNNAFAHQELGFISLLRDDRATANESLELALRLSPSADVRAAIGVNFVKLGDSERGFALIEKGMAESPRAPPFFFLGYVVNSLRMHDDQAALKWAERMATPEWPLSQAILAAVAARADRQDVAHRAVARLLVLRPNFAANGRELIRRGRLGPEFEAEVARGLARAGLDLR